VTPGPVIGRDGTIYAASNAGILHAIDPNDGQDLWTVDEHGSYGVDQSTSPAVLPNGIILWPGPHGDLVAVSPGGSVLWRFPLGGQVASPAVRADGTVVVGNDAGLLVGLRPTATGPAETWRVDLAEKSYGSPAMSADGTTAYQSVVSGVVAVRGGKVLWRWKVPSKIVEVSPAVAPSGTIVIGTNDSFEYGLDPGDGSVRWRYRRDALTYSSPGVTADDIAYFGDHRDRIVGIDASSGKVVFRHQGSTQDSGPGGIGIWTAVLVDSRHTTYAGTRQGLIYAVSRTGKQLWSYDAGSTVDSYPALTADGTLVIGTTDGRLLAFANR
jgi:outer membrane protein assembly factor BamB